MEEVTAKTVSYVVASTDSGQVVGLFTVPRRMMPQSPGVGQKLVIVTDGKLPSHNQYVLKLDMMPEPVTYVEQFGDIVAVDEMPTGHGKADLDTLKQDRIREVDQVYAGRMASLKGPLENLHAEKRRQAEAGGGPLVVDDADRLAILANAAAQDAALAEIERERRAVKRLLRAAKTKDDLAAAVAAVSDKKSVK